MDKLSQQVLGLLRMLLVDLKHIQNMNRKSSLAYMVMQEDVESVMELLEDPS